MLKSCGQCTNMEFMQKEKRKKKRKHTIILEYCSKEEMCYVLLFLLFPLQESMQTTLLFVNGCIDFWQLNGLRDITTVAIRD